MGEGKVPTKNKVKLTDQENSKKGNQDDGTYEDRAVQKEDIINAIKIKTEDKEEKVGHNNDENELAINNEIQTYTSSEIITSSKVKKKKDKEVKKNKKEQKTKEIMEKKKQREEKKKLKQ